MTAWYVDRSAGLVAWALLSASTVLGLLLSSRALGRRARPAWLQDLHRGVSALAVAFTGVHVAAAIADNHLAFGFAEVLVPFTSSWRPWAIAWGVVSTYLLLAVELTSLLRTHLPRAVWRRIHMLSFPLFITATAHGITAGTDLATTAGVATASLVTAAVAGLTALRVLDASEGPVPHPHGPRTGPAPTTTTTLADGNAGTSPAPSWPAEPPYAPDVTWSGGPGLGAAPDEAWAPPPAAHERAGTRA